MSCHEFLYVCFVGSLLFLIYKFMTFIKSRIFQALFFTYFSAPLLFHSFWNSDYTSIKPFSTIQEIFFPVMCILLLSFPSEFFLDI